MASNEETQGSSSSIDEPPLWDYVEKQEKQGSGGTWKFKCKVCGENRQGSYSRVRAHLLGIKVLRVWDVILFEGNRAMLLRTALALMELYGPDVGSTMDAGDAITLLQSLVGSTFDSSNLIVTACISFSYVTEDTLQTLRQKHRPDVIAAVQERTKGDNLRKSSKGLATKLYSFKKEREPIVRELSIKQGLNEKGVHKDGLDLMSPLKRDMSFNMEPINTEMLSFRSSRSS